MASRIIHPALQEIAAASTSSALEEVRLAYLGRSGSLTAQLKGLKDLTEAQRRVEGPALTSAKRAIEDAVAARSLELAAEAHEKRITDLDLSRPGIPPRRGSYHPLTLVEREVRRAFASMNFAFVDGPEVETEHYNFDALNIPADHPARDMWDTFWLEPLTKGADRLLLRTHTSPVQVRFMEAHEPPLRIVSIGRVFRYEATDATHEVNFGQVEGLAVGTDVTLGDLKGMIEGFFTSFFDGRVEFRYRASYFPFVEPGFEVDVRIGKGPWLEVMGAGMVHQSVLEAAGYERGAYQGFAFGVGLDRLAMIRHGITDVRLLYAGDPRVSRQFS